MAKRKAVIEERMTLVISRNGLSYIVTVTAKFLEMVEGEYLLVDDFTTTKLPFELTAQDRRTIIDALYKMSDKFTERKAQNVPS